MDGECCFMHTKEQVEEGFGTVPEWLQDAFMKPADTVVDLIQYLNAKIEKNQDYMAGYWPRYCVVCFTAKGHLEIAVEGRNCNCWRNEQRGQLTRKSVYRFIDNVRNDITKHYE